jgi:hypothetical protein
MPNIRSPRVLGASLLAGAAAVAVAVVPALAQDATQSATRIEASARASPSKAGTPRHPVGLAVTAQASLITAPDLEPPIVTGIDIRIGKGLTWNRGGYTTCSKAVLDRSGPKGCPKQSVVGTAYATGRADTVPAKVDLTFFNGGKDIAYVYAVLDNPARVRETLTLRTRQLTGPGPWGEAESVSIPRSLQIVAGLPLNMDRIKFTIGGKSYARNFIASTGCPKGGWRYEVTAHYLYESSGATSGNTTSGSIACS